MWGRVSSKFHRSFMKAVLKLEAAILCAPGLPPGPPKGGPGDPLVGPGDDPAGPGGEPGGPGGDPGTHRSCCFKLQYSLRKAFGEIC